MSNIPPHAMYVHTDLSVNGITYTASVTVRRSRYAEDFDDKKNIANLKADMAEWLRCKPEEINVVQIDGKYTR